MNQPLDSEKRVAWVTDAHLDHIAPKVVKAFFDQLVATKPDALLFGGDIAQADTVEDRLTRLASMLKCPIYFVLGNHDFYNGSFADMHSRMRSLTHEIHNLTWLHEVETIQLSEATGLVGVGGWGDTRLGKFEDSTVRLNDWVYIEDLAALNHDQLRQKLLQLGQDAANHLKHVLPAAIRKYQHIIVLTHVPPFEDACWYRGKPALPGRLPFYACGAVGEVLYNAALENQFHRFIVLCGHTHTHRLIHILPNLQVRSGGAQYGSPRIEKVLELV